MTITFYKVRRGEDGRPIADPVLTLDRGSERTAERYLAAGRGGWRSFADFFEIN